MSVWAVYVSPSPATWPFAKNFHRKFSLRAAPLKMSTGSFLHAWPLQAGSSLKISTGDFLNARPPIWKSMVSLIPVAHAGHTQVSFSGAKLAESDTGQPVWLIVLVRGRTRTQTMTRTKPAA
jgi:hypothetical protein